MQQKKKDRKKPKIVLGLHVAPLEDKVAYINNIDLNASRYINL